MGRIELVHNKALVAALGLFTHYILYASEWDTEIPRFLATWLLAFGGIAAAEYTYNPHVNTVGDVFVITSTTAAIYFGALSASVLIYRGFFHRLRNIPGPFLARFSKFHSIFAGVIPTNFRYFKSSEALHERYKTDVIRTGPREVTVYCADAVPLIHGPMSRCSKGPWYGAVNYLSGVSLQTTRSKEEHKQRRKIWDRAFNAKSLRDYEPRLNRHALALMEKLKEQAKKPSVRITNWANFYSFDVMGDVGFNRSYGMVEKGEEDASIKLLHESMEPLSVFGHANWALNLVSRTAVGSKKLLDHIEWTSKALTERVKSTPKEHDIFGYLIDPNDPKVTIEMVADARLLVVAGSDTTGATLSFISYELCKNPEVQIKLRKAIDGIKPEKSFLDVEDVANCAFLDGVINEALRLHPAVPSGVQRETPPEGITLPNGTYIPGSTLVWMPIHCIQRDPRYFESPLEFMPERWTDEKPEAIMDKRAFMPFGTGVYSCVGQKLAMAELRSVVANWMRLFEMEFAEGEDGSTIVNESRDCFTTNVGKVDVKLTPRYET
ncbi:cytochrome P450 [Dothidotthia symphoricarpi CBS 119687]|uniref:Cytochrome P450 n=1 Tax=Dothidotthia symphoricarpi CBS 119687 TaxID=1392245 RepID=A0A6A6AHI8_9PLEO|nr:cytochrome P450 [Dothidotthia symphoricarpi CBS 119687]KAF2129891.1 cytochrome P450 [Dothidotthia symphoricarpi CBS 119687]